MAKIRVNMGDRLYVAWQEMVREMSVSDVARLYGLTRTTAWRAKMGKACSIETYVKIFLPVVSGVEGIRQGRFI